MFTPACHKIKFWCRSSKDPIKTKTQHREMKRLKWKLHSSNNFYNCFEEITWSNNNLHHSWKFLFRWGTASLHRYLIKRYSKEKLWEIFFWSQIDYQVTRTMRKRKNMVCLQLTKFTIKKLQFLPFFSRKYSYSEDTILANIFNTITQNKCIWRTRNLTNLEPLETTPRL